MIRFLLYDGRTGKILGRCTNSQEGDFLATPGFKIRISQTIYEQRPEIDKGVNLQRIKKLIDDGRKLLPDKTIKTILIPKEAP